MRPKFLLVALSLMGLVGIGRSADCPAANSPAEPGYTVVVEMKVNPDGSVADASVVRSENDYLSRLALATVRTWKLPPKEGAASGAAYRAEAPVFFPVEGDQGAAADLIPKPQPREVVRPVYPPHLRNSEQAGGAILEFTVDVTGRVRKPEVLRASHREFGEAARKALLLWRFYPAEAKWCRPGRQSPRMSSPRGRIDSRGRTRPKLGQFPPLRVRRVPIQSDLYERPAPRRCARAGIGGRAVGLGRGKEFPANEGA